MTEIKKSAGDVPASADSSECDQHQTAKGCLMLSAIVVVFLIVSIVLAIMTGVSRA